jgi:hypothetical protein
MLGVIRAGKSTVVWVHLLVPSDLAERLQGTGSALHEVEPRH